MCSAATNRSQWIRVAYSAGKSNRGCQMKFSNVICNVRSGDMRQLLQALGMGYPP